MALWRQWIAFTAVVLMLYIADIKHMATIRYNFFLLLLLGMITGLILFLKMCHRQQ
ncbi:MAG: hypothetical protein JRH18_13575 [Deltaproteobacteria bacterium]|nr:hypothetical protein [Deltaproteobacteria bacterium]MBW1994502.1 hypothetical protein [Deltaproteobacteria bacterium]MBW2152685.1 hypothetical protein [Deltaproteobacteria bacterium]